LKNGLCKQVAFKAGGQQQKPVVTEEISLGRTSFLFLFLAQAPDTVTRPLLERPKIRLLKESVGWRVTKQK